MKHFKKFDKFGEKFSFNYNDYEKYSTRVGGFVFLIFIIISLFYFILSFFPFYKKENFSLQFYTIHSSDEAISINNFSFGIECIDKDNKKINNDYFNLNIKYKKNKKYENFDIKNCTSEDIQIKNDYNISIDDFKCINSKNEIKGIYTEENFSYFKITVESKNNNVEEIDNLLKNNECKLQIYYQDFIFNIDNYQNYYKLILNSLFIQINPDFDIKKNVFFMKYNFKNEDNLIDISFFNDHEKKNEFVGFSRTEDYFIFNTTIPNENENKRYATLFIRADNRKTEIIRKYQNLLDFYAENTSIWFGIFEALNIFFTIYNGYHANISMSKKLFFFDEMKEDNKYNMLRKNSLNSNNSKLKNKTINSSDNNINEITNINSYYENKNKEENIKNEINNEKNIISEKSFSSTDDENVIQKSKIQIEENKKINEIRLFEIIKISFFSCFVCCKKNEKYKEKIIKKAINIFDKKLDIYIYIKNMILLDIMYQILMSDINKDYVNFLSRSLIYLDKNIKEQSKELEAIYKPSSKLNYDYSNKLFKKFTKLVEKEEKTEIERKLVYLYMKVK